MLRELKESDAKYILKWWNDVEITSYLFGFCMPATKPRVDAWVKKEMDKEMNPFFIIDTLVPDNQPEMDQINPLGYIALRDIEPKDRHANLKYIIGNKEQWRKGFAYDATKTIISFGFKELRLHRINANCFVPNTASMCLLKKLGFQNEGIRRQQTFIHGQWVDVACWGLLKEEWEQ
ncbi:MAG: GNAT family N-acetyltransferase [Candidatus Lloydbacteria bacterium]|nr:GNAT family N-acetyltransferase [Candidatus Lloydbacteria bacterium]